MPPARRSRRQRPRRNSFAPPASHRRQPRPPALRHPRGVTGRRARGAAVRSPPPAAASAASAADESYWPVCLHDGGEGQDPVAPRRGRHHQHEPRRERPGCGGGRREGNGGLSMKGRTADVGSRLQLAYGAVFATPRRSHRHDTGCRRDTPTTRYCATQVHSSGLWFGCPLSYRVRPWSSRHRGRPTCTCALGLRVQVR